MKVTMYNGVKADNYFYFVCYNLNLLCRWNIRNCEMDIIGSAPEEPLFKPGLFGNLLYKEDTLFLIPFNAAFLWKYEIKDARWLKIELPKTECKEHKFYGGVIKDQYLYLLGYNYPAILKMNINTCEIKVIRIEKNVIPQDYLYSGILGINYHIDDRYITTPMLCNNIILKMDIVNDSLQYIPITGSKIRCVGIASDGKNYWLAPRYGNKYLIWDGDRSFKEKEIAGINLDDEQYFGSCYVIGEDIYFTSFIGDSIRKNMQKDVDWEKIPKIFYFGKIISDHELILGTNEGEIWWYKDGQKKEIECGIAKKKYYRFLQNEEKNGRLLTQETNKESQFFGLDIFLQLLQEENFDE